MKILNEQPRWARLRLMRLVAIKNESEEAFLSRYRVIQDDNEPWRDYD